MNILVVAPHPDDAEIGMGGTIARFAEQGHAVLIVDLTDGCPTPRGDRPTRLREAADALAHLQPRLGGSAVRRIMLDLKNREVQPTIQARHQVAGVIRAHQAQVMFIPQWEDAHPDHLASTRLAEDARFDAKLTKVDMPAPPGLGSIGPPIYPRWLFYYDVSHLRRVSRPDFCVDITPYVDRKAAAVRAYRSQFGPWDDPAGAFAPGDPKADPGKLVSPDFPERLRAYGAFWGSRIGVEFAEPFWTREPLGLTGLDGLVP